MSFNRALAESQMIQLKLPFNQLKIKSDILRVPVTLVVPPTVELETFKKIILKDCKEYYEFISKNEKWMTPSDWDELLASPLPVTMKNQYEVVLQISNINLIPLSENIQIKLKPLALESFEIINNDISRIKMNSRGLMCDWLKGASDFKVKFNMWAQYFELNERLKTLFSKYEELSAQVDEILNQHWNQKTKAIVIGSLYYNFKKQNNELVKSENITSRSIWRFYFKNSISLEKSSYWNDSSHLIDSNDQSKTQKLIDFNHWLVQEPVSISLELENET